MSRWTEMIRSESPKAECMCSAKRQRCGYLPPATVLSRFASDLRETIQDFNC